MTDDDLTEIVDAIRNAIGTNDEPKIKACIRCRFHTKSPALLGTNPSPDDEIFYCAHHNLSKSVVTGMTIKRPCLVVRETEGCGAEGKWWEPFPPVEQPVGWNPEEMKRRDFPRSDFPRMNAEKYPREEPETPPRGPLTIIAVGVVIGCILGLIPLAIANLFQGVFQ